MTPRSRGARRPKFDRNFRTSRKGRAQGMLGARCTRGLVCKRVVETHTSIQGSGEHPTFPAQWFYGLCRALPGDEFGLASVTGGLKDCSNPFGSTLLRRVDTSNGCRDHTVLPYAAVRLSPGWRRSSARCVRSRTISPPCDHDTRPTLPRPPQPVPRS
jgi:hypothetical protein